MPETRQFPLDCQLEYHTGTFSLACDFQAESPCLIGLFGPSGSGKSTLLRLLAGLMRPDNGHIRLGDHTWFGPNRFLPPHRRQVGYVFQDARLFPHRNVADNLLFGLRQRRLTIDADQWNEILQVLDLEPLLNRWPHQLSGGQQQRVAIGRALLSQPRLLLLDEPLSGLDQSAKAEILPYLERIHRLNRLLTFYVSHDWHEIARLADRVIVLDHGRQVADAAITSLAQHLALNGAYLPDHAPVNVFDMVVSLCDTRRQLLQAHRGNARLWLPADCRQRQIGEPVRVMLAAADIALATTVPENTSFLNTLPGHISHITAARDGIHLVTVRHHDLDLLASVSSASLHTLQLVEGKQVFALIKGSRLGY